MTTATANLVQVNSYRGFSLRIDPQDGGEMPTVYAFSILTGVALPPTIGQIAASVQVDNFLRDN